MTNQSPSADKGKGKGLKSALKKSEGKHESSAGGEEEQRVSFEAIPHTVYKVRDDCPIVEVLEYSAIYRYMAAHDKRDKFIREAEAAKAAAMAETDDQI